MHPPTLRSKMPPGVKVQVPGRGTGTVFDTGETDGRPVLVLLHGWNVDGVLNFGHAIPSLREHRRVVVADLHGHGFGHRSSQRFELQACARDVIAIADELRLDRFVVAGFSLGGTVAQLLARDHTSRVAGAVFAATSSYFSGSRREFAEFRALRAAASLARRAPAGVRGAILDEVITRSTRGYPDWVADVVRAADPIALLQAGAALGRFDSRSWIDDITIPTATVVTARDGVIAAERQRELAQLLPDNLVVELEAGHNVPLADDARLGSALRRATDDVIARSTLTPWSPSAEASAPSSH